MHNPEPVLLFVLTWRLFRAIKMNLANEGLEAKRKEEEVIHRKRKAEDDKSWEGTLSPLQHITSILPS